MIDKPRSSQLMLLDVRSLKQMAIQNGQSIVSLLDSHTASSLADKAEVDDSVAEESKSDDGATHFAVRANFTNI